MTSLLLLCVPYIQRGKRSINCDAKPSLLDGHSNIYYYRLLPRHSKTDLGNYTACYRRSAFVVVAAAAAAQRGSHHCYNLILYILLRYISSIYTLGIRWVLDIWPEWRVIIDCILFRVKSSAVLSLLSPFSAVSSREHQKSLYMNFARPTQ